MIDHVWTVFCTRSVIDKDTNNVSLFEVLEKISAAGEAPPQKEEATAGIPVNAQLVTLWARRNPSVPGKGRARVVFESPSGRSLSQTDYEVDLTSSSRSRARGAFQVLPVPESGWYRFKILQQQTEGGDWREVASIPLEVELQVKQSGESGV